MALLKLLLDTNVVIDHLNRRKPFDASARLVMAAGRMGDFELWITMSQVTDLIYILSEGGSHELVPHVLEQLTGLRTFVRVFAAGEPEVDRMLASAWKDPEDCLLYQSALSLKADAIITRNQKDFEGRLVQALSCEELLQRVESDHGIAYEEVAF